MAPSKISSSCPLVAFVNCFWRRSGSRRVTRSRGGSRFRGRSRPRHFREGHGCGWRKQARDDGALLRPRFLPASGWLSRIRRSRCMRIWRRLRPRCWPARWRRSKATRASSLRPSCIKKGAPHAEKMKIVRRALGASGSIMSSAACRPAHLGDRDRAVQRDHRRRLHRSRARRRAGRSAVQSVSSGFSARACSAAIAACT